MGQLPLLRIYFQLSPSFAAQQTMAIAVIIKSRAWITRTAPTAPSPLQTRNNVLLKASQFSDDKRGPGSEMGFSFRVSHPPPCRTEFNTRSEWVYEFPITLRAPTTQTSGVCQRTGAKIARMLYTHCPMDPPGRVWPTPDTRRRKLFSDATGIEIDNYYVSMAEKAFPLLWESAVWPVWMEL